MAEWVNQNILMQFPILECRFFHVVYQIAESNVCLPILYLTRLGISKISRWRTKTSRIRKKLQSFKFAKNEKMIWICSAKLISTKTCDRSNFSVYTNWKLNTFRPMTACNFVADLKFKGELIRANLAFKGRLWNSAYLAKNLHNRLNILVSKNLKLNKG